MASEILGCRPWMFASIAASRPNLMMRCSTSFWICSTTSSMREGWIRPSSMSFCRASAATARRTGSKQETTTTPGGVVDDDVGAGGFFKGADVAALTADDPAFHVVAGDVDDGDGVVGGVLGGVALHGLERDLDGVLLGVLLGSFHLAFDELGGFVLDLVLHDAEGLFAGFFLGEVAQA